MVGGKEKRNKYRLVTSQGGQALRVFRVSKANNPYLSTMTGTGQMLPRSWWVEWKVKERILQ